MTWEERHKKQSDEWLAALKANGHTPFMDGGKLDDWALDSGYHNGPGCSACGENWCQHCDGPEVVKPCSHAVLELKAEIAGSSEPPTTAEKPATKDQMAEQFANQFNVVVNGGRDRD